MDEYQAGDYRTRFPTVEDDRWLPIAFNPALTGMAERLGELTPVYSCQALLALWSGFAPADVLRQFHNLCTQHPQVLILHKPAKEAFWRRVQEKQFIAWELLTPAIVGVAAYGTSLAHATVYDRSKVLGILAATVTDGGGADPNTLAVSDYRSKLLSCNAGKRAPWYFFH
jgi:hypothetical protein